MKNLLYIGAAALLLSSAVQAQTCFDFDPYCDGLELTLEGGRINGWWRNTDCNGTDVEMHGRVVDGVGEVECMEGRPCVAGYNFGFVIDGLPLDGTMVMYREDGGWNVWLDPLNYDEIAGPCPFDEGSEIMVSTIQAFGSTE